MNFFKILLASMVLASSAGCASYRWKSSIPEDRRSVFVPVFRNESDVTELGNVVARQLLREFQHEGTFKISGADDCALEIQGVIGSSGLARVNSSSRDYSNRRRESRFTAEAHVTVIDKKHSEILLDRKYVGRTTFYGDYDVLTLQRNASGRIAEDIARQIVDDVLDLEWK